MDLKNFRKSCKLSQSELADLFECSTGHISNIESGNRSLTGLQIRLLIEKYGFDVVSKYADPEELPANITVNMPKVENNSGQINGGGGNSMSTVDGALVQALNESLKQQTKSQELLAKSQEQIDRLITLLEKK